MKKINLLYLSGFIPFNGIRHAGGKTLNFYVDEILKHNDIEITMVGFYQEWDKENINKDKKNWECYPIATRGSIYTDIKRVVWDCIGLLKGRSKRLLPYYLHRELLRKISFLHNMEYNPDIIVLEWTNLVLEIDFVKKLFPNAKYIASEHDISFQGMERRINNRKKVKHRNSNAFIEFKKMELKSLTKCNVVMTQSHKDKTILTDSGISEKRINVITPFYHDMRQLERKRDTYDILFWGAMNRPENEEAAIWFIHKVMPLLDVLDVRFVIVGNKPSKKLIKMSSNRVVITGYVEDESVYFEKSLCFVAPLINGAGIKVKIIEAMSSGIPVLTNDIGIEGIPAKDEVDFFYCREPQDYAKIIKELIEDPKIEKKISENSMMLINKNFNLTDSVNGYLRMIYNLI